MSVEDYVEQIFIVKCGGRDEKGEEVLPNPLKVEVKIYKTYESNTLSSVVECKYNAGGHGQRCKASHPRGVDNVGKGVICPYSFDIPHALENKK